MPKTWIAPCDIRAALYSPTCGLSAIARHVLRAALDYSPPSGRSEFPPQKVLMDLTGWGEKAVRGAIRECVAKGWLPQVEPGVFAVTVPVPRAAAPAHRPAPQAESPESVALRKRTQERLDRERTRREKARVIITYYRDRTGRSDRFICTPQRETLVMNKLRENGDDDSELLYVVDGLLKDDHLMGREARSTRKYDDLSLIYRDREHIERLSLLGGMNGKPHPSLEHA